MTLSGGCGGLVVKPAHNCSTHVQHPRPSCCSTCVTQCSHSRAFCIQPCFSGALRSRRVFCTLLLKASRLVLLLGWLPAGVSPPAQPGPAVPLEQADRQVTGWGLAGLGLSRLDVGQGFGSRGCHPQQGSFHSCQPCVNTWQLATALSVFAFVITSTFQHVTASAC